MLQDDSIQVLTGFAGNMSLTDSCPGSLGNRLIRGQFKMNWAEEFVPFKKKDDGSDHFNV